MSTQTFPLRVAKALDDPALQTALRTMSGHLRTRRAAAFESLPDADTIRDHARHAKLDTLRDLASNLETFEARVIANGGVVHWAETAADANQIVVDIARHHAVQRVAKGKSMVSEETHLNDALAAAGLSVVETDLGEYIVQLAGDRPSHIVAPIIHLSRAEVGRVMHQHLHTPLTDDPVTLGGYARERLRHVFLEADMGLTGANFGVVETGTICLVTNEGNGRMVSGLPRVHVVLMGIEKLIPTLADLDRFLKVLPRSATGQKLTAYTTLIHGPRRPDDDCGPQALHVVLIDNGRTRLMASESAEILGCIRCGACMNVCPVYTSIGGHAYGDTYPGPVGAVVTPGLRGLHEWADLPSASSLCGACRDVCPVRLDIPRMLLALRAQAAPWQAPAWLNAAMRAFAAVVTRPAAYRLANRVMRLALRRRAREGWVTHVPGPAAAWTTSRDLPAPAAKTFQELWRERSSTS
ncbi:MAG TPA: LutB/LldF family L-lactate oxidation iron-sulfur protein [Vicinamibacterales bacterium]|nr:LutB/LldF family L-lactate oxidation iron-sulfur protein [Vicinamibacterales bacterium]